ncbi:hypothetical protein M8J75_009741 [Diaphorina citri]|nr:hypothetical protein M8J75_009741 [Diaphorina citri]
MKIFPALREETDATAVLVVMITISILEKMRGGTQKDTMDKARREGSNYVKRKEREQREERGGVKREEKEDEDEEENKKKIGEKKDEYKKESEQKEGRRGEEEY